MTGSTRFVNNTRVDAGIEIKYNAFCNVTVGGSRHFAGWESLSEMDGNLWSREQGFVDEASTQGCAEMERNTP